MCQLKISELRQLTWHNATTRQNFCMNYMKSHVSRALNNFYGIWEVWNIYLYAFWEHVHEPYQISQITWVINLKALKIQNKGPQNITSPYLCTENVIFMIFHTRYVFNFTGDIVMLIHQSNPSRSTVTWQLLVRMEWRHTF